MTMDVVVARKGKDGKSYWRTIGVGWQNEKNIRINFDALPMPDETGKCSVFLMERKDNVQKENEEKS